VLVIDVDHFKAVNDAYGHAAGDAALLAVSALVTAAVRSYDTVARFGGEEFVVLLPGVGEEHVVTVAERIRHAVSELVVPIDFADDGRAIRDLSVSIGVAMYPTAGTVVDRLLHAADTALYSAKNTGRNKVVSF